MYSALQIAMDRAFMRLSSLVCVLLLVAGSSRSWAQEAGKDEIIQQMLRIVLESNPTLASQAKLVLESERLPAPRGGIALSGMSLSLGTAYPDTGAISDVRPAVMLGTSFSIADPVRALNAYSLKKAREEARQQYLKIKDELVADLLSTVRELLKLSRHRQSQEKLEAYLRDYSDLIDKQVRAGAASAELAKLWDLKERLLGVEAEIEDMENQLSTMRLEAALRLAGDSWGELLELFSRLGG